MKKFGLGRKEKSSEPGEDPSRSRLFGKSKSKGDSTAPASTNPYAAPTGTAVADPYAQPSQPYGSSGGYGSSPAGYGTSSAGYGSSPSASYAGSSSQQSNYGGLGPPPSNSAGSRSPSVRSQQQPPPYTGGAGYSNDRSRNDKSPVPSGGYGSSRYADQSYGNQAGYGGDQFGGSDKAGSIASSRPAGYRGLGRTGSQETMGTEAGRDALFGGAKDRYAKKLAENPGLPAEEDPGRGGGGGGGVGGGGGGDEYAGFSGGVPDMGYGTYQDRQLTAEEEEEEDVQATKGQIRQIKQQDVSSTRNALRIAEEAEQTGRETLERLGAQGERIHNTEKNLDLAANQNRLAEEKARELKHLNRSMWAMHVSNPLTAKRRDREREEGIISQHHADRSEREATRAAAYQSSARREGAARDLNGGAGGGKGKKSLAERSKYQFEADSEDEAMEEEIDGNLEALGGAASRLNQLGRAMGSEVDSQNQHIERIVGKADRVDDGIVLNRGRLERIEKRG